MLSSNLSLTLTSSTQEEDGYEFVGRRKKTPLTAIPLARYRPRADAATRRGGDGVGRNAQAAAAPQPFNFHLAASSSHCDESDGVEPAFLPQPVDAPSRRRTFDTSAATVGQNHARAVSCMQRLRAPAPLSELALPALIEDVVPLRTFEREHPVQLGLWIEAFARWPTFSRNLFPRQLVDAPAPALSVADGEMLLAVLPTAVTIAYVGADVRAAATKLQLSPTVCRLLTLPHLAEKAISLVVALFALEAATSAARYYSVIVDCLRALRTQPCYRQLLALASGSSGRASVWMLSSIVADPRRRNELIAAADQAGLVAELGVFDEVMDVVDQVDLEMALMQIQVYICTCAGALGQSLTLVRAVQEGARELLLRSGKSPPPTASEVTCSTATAEPPGEAPEFDDQNMRRRLDGLISQVAALQSALDNEVNDALATELGLEEAQSRPGTRRLPCGMLLKTLAIFVEVVRSRGACGE